MAIVLIRKMGCPRSSNPYGITDPKGNPACLRERVERLPMRAKYTKVRARSANEGSGTAGWLLAAPVPACFLKDEEDIPAPSWQPKYLHSGCTCWFASGRALLEAICPQKPLSDRIRSALLVFLTVFVSLIRLQG